MTTLSHLTRKQRNRLAADRSRKKRQLEHNRLKERVQELEAVNELLRRENESLASGRTSMDALLSQADLLLLRRLTAASPAKLKSGDDGNTSPVAHVQKKAAEGAVTATTTTTTTTNSTSNEILPDSLTTTPINNTADDTAETGCDFKPAALGQTPLQKEHAPSPLVSLRRTILAAMMTPKVVFSLRMSDTQVAEKRIIRILRGSKNISKRPQPTRHALVEQMFFHKSF